LDNFRQKAKKLPLNFETPKKASSRFCALLRSKCRKAAKADFRRLGFTFSKACSRR
jgi:hypothetical protein